MPPCYIDVLSAMRDIKWKGVIARRSHGQQVACSAHGIWGKTLTMGATVDIKAHDNELQLPAVRTNLPEKTMRAAFWKPWPVFSSGHKRLFRRAQNGRMC